MQAETFALIVGGGPVGLAAAISFFIRAPTPFAASKRPPTNMTWILNPDMRGMMYSQDGRETWVGA
jgi:hypothetical protein